MKFLKRIIFFLALSAGTVQPTFADSGFIVKQIQIEGLQGVSRSTVLSYLPIQIGQVLGATNSANVIQALYATGFFNDVNLQHRGNTLVIVVKERPTIGLINMTGNKSLPNKKLWEALRKMGATEGLPYDPTKFRGIEVGLKEQYAQLGRYHATVKTRVVPESRNRVALYIEINEGAIAKISSIHIEGNHDFSQRELLKTFKSSTSGIFTWYTHADRYSKMKMDQDLQSLQNFYYDHGYLDFRLVNINSDVATSRERVVVTITINEGQPYRIRGFELQGKYANDPNVRKLITLKDGQLFSREDIMDVNKKVANYFANKGYAFPFVNMVPKLDRNNHTAFLTFTVDPRKRMYVRRINFAGNSRTKDDVLRFQMRQMEGAPYNLTNINESKRLLNNLRYVSDIKVNPLPVAGYPDQVDLDYHVKEVNAGRASVQGGYSDAYGIIYGASVSEPNFMGTGKFASLGFNNSQYSSNYNLSYNNPFYTLYGMSRGFDVFYTNTTPNNLSLGSYKMDNYGANINYGLPISEFNTLTFGYGYQHIAVSVINSAIIAPSIQNFLNNEPSPYNQFTLQGGFVHGTLDRAVLPTSGNYQAINLIVGPNIMDSSMGYYKATYDAKWYFPMGHGFIIHPKAAVNYGGAFGDTNAYPFFYNYYGGGLETLPGFAPNSLGPRNPLVGQNNTYLGGNVSMFGTLNLIVPNGITDKLRTAVFVGAGNIFETYHVTSPTGVPQTQYENVTLGNLRASAGLIVEWYVPVLNWPISFSVSRAFNTQAGDSTQIFNFSIGGAL